MKTYKNNFLCTDNGYVFQNNNLIVYFGNINSSFEEMNILYPSINFQKIKQTHSDIVVESPNKVLEADSHYTAVKNTGLIIATADCIPIMIYCEQTQRVAAVHAGWRGIANQIIIKTLHKLIDTGSSNKNFEFWVGPHILQPSFEVEKPVFEQLIAASFDLKPEDVSYEKHNKYFLDLDKILISQINFALKKLFKITFLNIDTKSSDLFNSYRRKPDVQNRNISFISLL